MSPKTSRKVQIHHERRLHLLIRAAVVGVVAGIIAVLFQLAVQFTEDQRQSLASGMGHVSWLIIPPITALLGGVAAWITNKYSPESQGSGIPHTKAVLMNLRKLVPQRILTVKIGAGLMALASGMSLGREGPTVQIGAAIGHTVGKWLKVSRRSLGTLVAAGSGAGLAAAFNAPLAGFLFVMEEMKREMSPLTYGTALISSVCAVAVKRIWIGQQPEFSTFRAGVISLPELPLVVFVGIVCGFLGILFNKSIVKAIEFRDSGKLPKWVLGTIVGALAGVVVLLLPAATGGGHHTTESLLRGDLYTNNLLIMLALLLLVKFALTIFSFGSGVPGGIFAPILVMGAVTGYAIGVIGDIAFPSLGIVPAFFATVGMASFLAASVRAPLTGVVLIFEMTAEYRLLYALLIGAFVAYALAERFRNKPIYESLLDHDIHGKTTEVESDGTPNIIDLFVEPESELDGKLIKDIPLPDGCLIVQIHRGDEHVVPDGDTRIKQGDAVTLVSSVSESDEWIKLFDSARAP